MTPMLTREELASIRTIDLTTYGRKSGLPRRIEIWWFHVEDRFIITGTPGRRDWLANVRSNPRVVIGANGTEIEAVAREVVSLEFRELVFTQPETRWYATQAELRRLVEGAPMIEVLMDDSNTRDALGIRSRVELI